MYFRILVARRSDKKEEIGSKVSVEKKVVFSVN